MGNKNSNFSLLCVKKMATLTLLSSLSLRSSSSSSSSSFTLSSSFSSPSSFAFFCSFPLRSATSSLKVQTIQKKKRVVKAVEEDTQQELNAADDSEQPSTSEAPPVVVPVSPSDTLTMFFQVHHCTFSFFLFFFLHQLLVYCVPFAICNAHLNFYCRNLVYN